jgi:anti-sigma B factor antagonist
VVLDLSGKLSLPEVSLRDRIDTLIAAGHREFVLNLSNVRYMDSFGLGQLITIWTSIRNTGGQLLLLNPTGYVRKLFEITKLNTVFHISAEEGHTIASAPIADPVSTPI